MIYDIDTDETRMSVSTHTETHTQITQIDAGNDSTDSSMHLSIFTHFCMMRTVLITLQ